MVNMINWKLRILNKATLTALVAATVAFVYQVLSIFGIVPALSQSEVLNVCAFIINILVALGIVVDPTTGGICDSALALGYDKPRRDGGVDNG